MSGLLAVFVLRVSPRPQSLNTLIFQNGNQEELGTTMDLVLNRYDVFLEIQVRRPENAVITTTSTRLQLHDQVARAYNIHI